MAWEEFERNGIEGVSGDKPIDELSLALKRITTIYEERFSRKPTVVEILYAIETVIGTHPNRYVSDPEGLKFGTIIINRNDEKELDYINKDEYEGVYVEAAPLGYHAILQRDLSTQDRSQIEVIKIPTLEVKEKHLLCEYEILTEKLTESMAEFLIVNVLLGDYYDHDYRDEAELIEFTNIKFNTRNQVSYSSLI